MFAASVVAFYRRIPFVHVEAGLRTGDLSAPFPEEFHRRSIAVGTFLHCAPTETAAEHLRRESIPDERPSGAQGWMINTRRERFQDLRVREALAYAFDFEWANKNLMFDAYQRVADTELMEHDALTTLHTSLATIEGLTGSAAVAAQARTR